MATSILLLPGLRHGVVTPPPSKSHLHRLLIADFLAGGRDRFEYSPGDSADIAATRCPVFALNGERDWQVISSLNLTAIERNLPKSKNNVTKEYPGLNHLFQHCTTGSMNEYRKIEETIAPEVLSDIAEWINGLK